MSITWSNLRLFNCLKYSHARSYSCRQLIFVLSDYIKFLPAENTQ